MTLYNNPHYNGLGSWMSFLRPVKLNDTLELCYVKCNFHLEMLNVWLCCLFRWVFPLLPCDSSAQCVSKCARPVCSSAPQTARQASIAALRLFLEALLFAQSSPTGGYVEWKRTSVKIYREENWTRFWTRCNPSRKLRCRLFSSPWFARWGECGVFVVVVVFFFFYRQIRPNGSRDEN